jgi:methylenetetrahydrofolate dehydrogenase (NADP+)/methenyltetrahydrofolate cyclohydrolase
MIFQLPSRKEFEDWYMDIMKHHKELDMDGFFNMGDIVEGDYDFAPCTPKGILKYIKNGLNINLRGKNIVVVGSRGKLVGKPFIIMATNEGATVTGLNSVSDKTMKFTALKQADIVILASGVKGTVSEYDLSNNKIVYVMNVGIVFDENGKLDTELEVEGVGNVFYSPRIKGIGVSTVLSLLDNVCNYYEKNNKETI